jgi:hypothetical protein
LLRLAVNGFLFFKSYIQDVLRIFAISCSLARTREQAGIQKTDVFCIFFASQECSSKNDAQKEETMRPVFKAFAIALPGALLSAGGAVAAQATHADNTRGQESG